MKIESWNWRKIFFNLVLIILIIITFKPKYYVISSLLLGYLTEEIIEFLYIDLGENSFGIMSFIVILGLIINFKIFDIDIKDKLIIILMEFISIFSVIFLLPLIVCFSSFKFNKYWKFFKNTMNKSFVCSIILTFLLIIENNFENESNIKNLISLDYYFSIIGFVIVDVLNFLKNEFRFSSVEKLKNDNVEIAVDRKGANLLHYKVDGEEFMRNSLVQGNLPISFPFIEKLKDNRYSYSGKTYKILKKNGIVRLENFELLESNSSFLKLKLSSNKKTLKNYPFKFELFVIYKIKGTALEIEYNIINKNNFDMYFMFGTQPTFGLDINDDLKFSDYYLKFRKNENLKKYKLKNNFIFPKKEEIINDNGKVEITEDLFDDGKIIFEKLKSKIVILKNIKNSRRIIIKYEGFPYITFFKKCKDRYISIEPSFGLPDFKNTNEKLENKKGIQKLKKNEKFSAKLVIKGKV